MEKADDAGVYKISEELAIIQTVDFFTPIVDDPYWFGQIAAANALSDIYAMGGVPKTAMNLAGFPLKQMDILYDPQTSGGLMICVKREQADALVSKLIDEGVAASKIIGKVISAPVEKIFVV